MKESTFKDYLTFVNQQERSLHASKLLTVPYFFHEIVAVNH